MTPAMAKLATMVGQVLADEGVRVAFGVVGNGNFLAVAGLMAGGARYVAARHEGGAIAMAGTSRSAPPRTGRA
jgi:acetolactate synthase-1/2/3 large subunit